ncbi:hypothetical protein SDRG_11510 [Saprolegnia diclina VS20]|uniref:Proteasome activator complex subunit 4 C-terminal domain-containing protein n=1 Tax=Saprolegnia diclina (strain VS20) TaxID=1156394 RepID=T0QB39_SAPDV|nr:hypothetical protein SDRG_11510 [Saprolegnia diclina VS20]EQC30750.1 hypothetical protein SDRG_11510 [Saprolegnia diclina VS20]|eukprot:XP_008615774.1 hypothetical protein SDRG_11510 [Saprolegnia diclina VS20]
MHVFSSLLPSSEQATIAADEVFLRGQLHSFLGLLQAKDHGAIAFHHFRTLQTFFKRKYTLEDPSVTIDLIHALVDYVFMTSPRIELQVKALDAAVLLIKKARKQSLALDGPSNLQLQWATALQVWDTTFYATPGPVLPVSSTTQGAYKTALIKYLSKARKSYPSDATLWTFVAPRLVETETEGSLKAAATLSLLWSPSMEATPLLSQWVAVWARINTLQEWDLHWLRLFSRVAKHEHARGTLDAAAWAPHLPFLFAKIQHCLSLPSDMGPSPARNKWPKTLSGLHGEKHALYYASKLVVYLLSSASEAQSMLLQLLHLLEPFFHPSSANNAANGISDLMYYTSAFLCLRSGHDRAEGRPTVEASPLVVALIDLAFLGIYAKSQSVSSKSSFTLRNILCLSRTHAPRIVETLLRGLDPSAVSQTHQAPSAISALTICGPALLRGDLQWAPNVLPSILHLTLPGIDPNDDTKTSRTLQLYATWLMYLPLANDTSRPLTPRSPLSIEWLSALDQRLFASVTLSSDVDTALWATGDALEAWVLQLLDRLFVLFKQQEKPDVAKDSNEDKFQIGAHLQHVATLLFAQLSPSMYTLALRRVADFVAATYIPTAGKLVAGFLAAVVAPHPNQSLPQLLVPAMDRVLGGALTESELAWQLRLVDGCVKSTVGTALLPFHSKLKAVVSASGVHESPKIVKLGCKILRHVLARLTSVYQPDYGRALPPMASAIAETSSTSQFLGVSLSWGALEPVWHEPSTDELGMAADWLATFALVESTLTATSASSTWRTRLRHILHAVRGAKPLLLDPVASTNLPIDALPSVLQTQKRLEAVLSAHPDVLTSLLTLRARVAAVMRDVVGVWYDSTDLVASKCLRYALRVMTLILHPRDAAHVANVRMYSKWRKLSSGDTASKAMTQRVLTSASSIPLLPRRLMQERLSILLAEHYDDRSFAYTRFVRTHPTLVGDPTVASGLLDAVAHLAVHPLAKTRKAAQSALDKVASRYSQWHAAQLPLWASTLTDEATSHHVITGVLHLLQLQRSLHVIWKDWTLAESLLGTLCRAADVKQRTAEDEMKTSARVLKTFLQLLASVRDADGIPPVASLMALEADMQGHWRFQLMHLASILPWLRADRPVPTAIWGLILRRVVSDVPQVVTFARLLLSRALKVHQANGTEALPTDVLETLFATTTLSALTRDLVLDHKTAQRSADGQSADASPARWSLGVHELVALVENEAAPHPLRAFGPQATEHISPLHVLFVTRLAVEASGTIDVFGRWQPLLANLAACDTDERRASLSTLGSILVGLAPENAASLFQAVLPKLSVPYAHDWYDVVLLYLRRRHDVALLEYIVNETETALAAADAVDATGQVRWLVLSQPVAIHLVYEAPNAVLSQRLVDVATKALDHPYAFVREQVAALLYIFTNATDVTLPFAACQRGIVYDTPTGAVHDKELSLRKTVLSWLAAFVSRGDSPQFEVLLLLFPIAFDTQAFPDADVARSARIVVEAIATKLRLFSSTQVSEQLITCLASALASPQWRTRGAVLRFLTVFNFHHGLLSSAKPHIEALLLSRLEDDVRDVQDMAQFSLRGFVRTLSQARVAELATAFLTETSAARLQRAKREKQLKRLRLILRVKKEGMDLEAAATQLAALEATSVNVGPTVRGCFGIGAIVLAYPYSVPVFVPAILEELALHVHEAAVTDVVKAVLLEFKRTHQDSWHEDKAVFTRSQLEAIEELLISPHYYT